MIIRIFPRRTSYTPTDELAFVGLPQLSIFRPEKADYIHISVTFTWDIEKAIILQQAWQAYYPSAIIMIDGPAIYNPWRKPSKFIPGLYVKTGVTFTTRGCENCCPWCLVSRHEGKLKVIEDFAPGHIIQDNNLLQAPKSHIEKVIEMLKKQKKGAIFAGGLEAALVRDWFVEELRGMRIGQVFLAADTIEALRPLERALEKLRFLPLRKKRVYVMIGRKESIKQAEERLRSVFEMGALPFAQLYQPEEGLIKYESAWKALARKWSRPAAMLARNLTPRSKEPSDLFPEREGVVGEEIGI